MALKLQVPWNTDYLSIDYTHDTIGRLAESEGQYIERSGDDVIVKDFFEDNNKVPDVGRYKISENDRYGDRKYRIRDDRYIVPHCDLSTQGDISRYDIQELEQKLHPTDPNIVLILESPHKSEYAANLRRPARGQTGMKIDRCLGTVLMHIHEEAPCIIRPGYHVIISNPIQFQTSLHSIHRQSLEGEWKTLRDNVWRRLWNEDNVRECFRTRIERYNPSLIINACTSDLKCHVNRWFSESRQETPLYEVAHPASWQNLRPKRVAPETS